MSEGSTTMSLNNDEREEPSDSRFECPICCNWLQSPLLTRCGHKFCEACIKQWLQKHTTCPVDNQLLKEIDLFPDTYTEREIQDLSLHKQSSSAQTKEQEQTECIFHAVGCEETIEKHNLHRHLQSNLHQHLQLLLKFSVLKKEKEANDTKAEEAKYFWEPDNKERLEQNGETCRHLMRTLYEKIIVLEQRSREQEIIIDNLKDKLSGLSFLSERVQKLETDLPLRYCQGVFVWQISDFMKTLEFFKKSKKPKFSQGFYTSPNGYKFCLRMNISPNQENYITLLIHLMKSENDVFLNWPFSGRIQFVLLNNNPSNHLSETIHTQPGIEAFQRPFDVKNNRGYGYPEFISIYDLIHEGFLFDDTIYIKAQVMSDT